ncbi:helix-turn-helix transcriptional regulator [Streptomyces oryzae]|uniref:Helix-turn-helix transcriptional regulator n=1 Tax=Streptomyces oryzae TaxID=1434886 RepID=A0ABS3XBT3_9ACTN|nr:helix-turn-helix transcriptional regulator [Streptomyces oryzae]MBO8192843.1 helix-turn-helix transcriptional regulator [Streptomyces oryzae]
MPEHDDEEWGAGLEDDSSAVLRAVSRQIKLWREAAGMTQPELGAAIGYGEEMVSAVERCKRLPKPEFLDGADKALGANGKISAMKVDVKEARYPKKVRDLAKLEEKAVERGAYGDHNIDGLLQTEEYARALFAMRRPAFSEEEIDRLVAGRMARQAMLERQPAPMLTFVQEEVTLRRLLGGRMVMRRQLEHMLEVAQLRHVTLQVMPTECEEHAGMAGEHRVLKLNDGTTLGSTDAQLTHRLISDPKEVQILEMRYGIIRSQALTPRESLAFIEKVLGET